MTKTHITIASTVLAHHNEHRYCGPCGEYYDDGDILQSEDFEPVELAAMTGTECPTCGETGRTVDELAEEQHERKSADFHDGGSTSWAMAEHKPRKGELR